MVVSSFTCSGIPTGDLNPIYNVPMLGTHKPRRDNHYQPFSFGDFPWLQPHGRDRRAPPLVVVHALIVRQKDRQKDPLQQCVIGV